MTPKYGSVRSTSIRSSTRRRQLWRVIVTSTILFGCSSLALVACSKENRSKSTPTPRPQEISVIDQRSVTATVANVLDGTTIEVEIRNERFPVRYLGVETPKSNDDDGLIQGALNYNRFLVTDEKVELARGVVNQDSLGNYLRYVYVRGEMANLSMLSAGYAVVSDFPADFKHLNSFVEAMHIAEQEERGVWSADSLTTNQNPLSGLARFQGGTLPVLEERRGPNVKCDHSVSSVPVIKGKVDPENDDKYYLIPGSTAYERSFIVESVGDRWFCTEVDARTEGFKQSRQQTS